MFRHAIKDCLTKKINRWAAAFGNPAGVSRAPGATGVNRDLAELLAKAKKPPRVELYCLLKNLMMEERHEN